VSCEHPSFDLVVATVGRTAALGRLLDSLEAQRYPRLRTIVVDQNADERVAEVLAGRGLELTHVRAPLGLSRARNVGLREVSGDVVGFPDDDCAYPPGLLDLLAGRFADDPGLDGLTGRAEDADGRSSSSWESDPAVLTLDNLWNRANAATTFLRRELVDRLGSFDERLGLGSGEAWSSGEETDYLVRAVAAGGRIVYDPSVIVLHELREDDTAIGLRDGASMGYLLRKHGYPPRTLARMLVRPVGGALLALARLDLPRARYYAATLRGRIRGYRGARRSNSSA
jgi:glycosyltransferase involved in cell wall biosynthesis